MKRRLAQLPLHSGQAPPWLFRRMTKLAGAIAAAIVEEFGPEELLHRLADPWWFQAFGCVLGFDWHSSGVTTVTCGALKEAAHRMGDDLGLFVAGGKGATSRNTPREIAEAADRHAITEGAQLINASRLSAKVDSAAVQDHFGIYHHTFVFTPGGQWCVIQQGMNEQSRWARRYHWLGEHLRDFTCEPHEAIRNLSEANPSGAGYRDCRDPKQLSLLNMVAEEAGENRNGSAALVRENPDWLLEEIKACTEGPTLFAPARHRVLPSDVNTTRLRQILIGAHEAHPENFQSLLGVDGVGPAAIRSLALLAEVIFNAPVSHRDPARSASSTTVREDTQAAGEERRWADYAYAHGGKDGTPFPVDRDLYDRNIALLTEAVRQARLGGNDKLAALRRLAEATSR